MCWAKTNQQMDMVVMSANAKRNGVFVAERLQDRHATLEQSYW